ncbi:SEC-C domain-containing protein [Streptomyces sp. RY43-2]|uniref:SEC-C domain-containing protein n=1 Tax=Streptomyces macrolidinus TaxID=2952607 RepID=A0ABT0ZLW3_9ACTN|nr:tetratricopeptide repeat protein [Streptomyces macrolidinus]MCN9244582.1 SEC-C domain-containing protein [Streptomyces macrolidinus]
MSTSERRAAEECERLAAHRPQDREELLLEAADAWQEAGRPERALALYERLLGPGGGGVQEPDLVDAFRIGALWDAGREGDARAAAEAFRKRHPRDPAAWNVVAEAFEDAGETATAAEWYTAGVTHGLGAGTPVTADAVEAARDGFDLETLVLGRHRVRRLLGFPHDDWDDTADELHARRELAWLGHARPLDEVHDPVRLKRAKDGGAEALDAEIAALTDTRDDASAPGAPRTTCVPYWPPEEFARLAARWPRTAAAYGENHADHRRQVERTLTELSEEGVPHLAVGHATSAGLEAHAQTVDAPPDTPDTLSSYATELARTGRTIAWPPPRNGPCWCGSGRKYKKCCGNPALT